MAKVIMVENPERITRYFLQDLFEEGVFQEVLEDDFFDVVKYCRERGYERGNVNRLNFYDGNSVLIGYREYFGGVINGKK